MASLFLRKYVKTLKCISKQSTSFINFFLQFYAVSCEWCNHTSISKNYEF